MNGAVPPDVAAVRTTVLPEQIAGADWEIVTFKVQGWLNALHDNNRNKHISKRSFINPDRYFNTLNIFQWSNKIFNDLLSARPCSVK